MALAPAYRSDYRTIRSDSIVGDASVTRVACELERTRRSAVPQDVTPRLFHDRRNLLLVRDGDGWIIVTRGEWIT